ncbi:secretory phospholipase A2 receptor-like [Pholidichthys leucotaenia]
MVTINDMGDMKRVLKATEGKYDNAVWIGLSKGTTRAWHWSLADEDFYEEGERNYLIWGKLTDNNCVHFLNRKYYSVNCGYKLNFVCFDEDNSEQQYVWANVSLNWMKARDYCRTHHTDLVSVRNETENLVVDEVAAGSKVWIGLFRDPWHWSDQTYSSFRYWKEGKAVYTDLTKHTCVAMLKSESGRWTELQCQEEHPFICKCPIVRIIKMELAMRGSALDQNDPAMLDDILKQISREVTRVGGKTVMLRWKKDPDGKLFRKKI